MSYSSSSSFPSSASSSAASSLASIQPQLPDERAEEKVPSSEVGDGNNGGLDKDAKLSLPVRAFFFSTSVDLRSLVEQNKQNFIPPTSRMTNYVVLKFGDHFDPTGTGGCISGSECIYMVVFQYEYEVRENPTLHTWMQGDWITSCCSS